MLRIIGAAAAALALSSAAIAQDGAETPEPRSFESSGQVQLENGDRVRYSVIAGETFLRDEDGEPTASIFSTTYRRDGDFAPREIVDGAVRAAANGGRPGGLRGGGGG